MTPEMAANLTPEMAPNSTPEMVPEPTPDMALEAALETPPERTRDDKMPRVSDVSRSHEGVRNYDDDALYGSSATPETAMRCRDDQQQPAD